MTRPRSVLSGVSLRPLQGAPRVVAATDAPSMKPRRSEPVARTTVRTAATLAPPEARASDTCACGHTYEARASVWQELRAGRLVSLCPGCEPGGPCR